MSKRKGSRASVDTPFELKKKKVPWSCAEDQKGSIVCTTPSTLMQSLFGDTTTEEFFASYWEKQPFVLKRNDSKFYGSLFTYSVMKEVLSTNEFEFHADVTVSHEKDIIREVGKVTVEHAESLIGEKKATFKFFHPQRYINELWRIVEKMETYFGCLVGSNAFITPADSKGSPPHCDDVETFILQIEGKVEWKLYKPMVELSRDYNQDLLEETIGEPTKTIILEPGDLLYFPRGTIHQCKTTENDRSSYVSITTYLQNTWGDFMCHAVSKAIENALESVHDVSIRSGLPINYLSFLGSGKNMSKYVDYADDDGKKKDEVMYRSNLENAEVVDFKKTVQGYLAKLVDHIDVNLAADSMCREFMGGRLPPFGHVPQNDSESVDEKATPADENTAPESDNVPAAGEKDEGDVATTDKAPITLDNLIKILYPEHIRLVYDEEEDDEIDSDYDSDDEMEVEEKAVKSETTKEKKSKSPAKHGRKTTSEGDDEEDEDAIIVDTEPSIKLLHSLHNDRFSHMGFSLCDEVEGVKLDVNYSKALVELLNSKDYVAVKDLLLDDDDDKLLLVNKLANDGLLEIKSSL